MYAGDRFATDSDTPAYRLPLPRGEERVPQQTAPPRVNENIRTGQRYLIQQQANTTLSSVLDLQREHRSLDLSRASGAAAAASAASRSDFTASAMEALVAFLSPSERRSLRMLRSSVSDRRSSMWKLPRVLKDSWRWRLSNCFRVIPGKKHHVLWPTAATRTGNRTRQGEGMRRCQLRLAIRAS